MTVVTNPVYSALLGFLLFALGFISHIVVQCLIKKCRKRKNNRENKLHSEIMHKLMSPPPPPAPAYYYDTPHPVHRSTITAATMPTPVFDKSYHSNVVFPSVRI